MNKIINRLLGGGEAKEKAVRRDKRQKPYTAAFNIERKDGEIVNIETIGYADGIKTLADFPGANVLNIVHKNNKTTVVK